MKLFFADICVKIYNIHNDLVRKILRALICKLDGGQAYSSRIREIMKNHHGIEIGIGTYGACFNPDQVWAGFGNLKVGKYTSIAKGVCIYTRNHPYWKPSLSPLFYNSTWGGVKEDTVEYGKLEIGNDVWLGQYAIILPSCKRIGDGAVIGAGAIVTANVPDYAVVAGNPAHVLKYRFDTETIEKLKRIEWWNWDDRFIRSHMKELQNMEELLNFHNEP